MPELPDVTVYVERLAALAGGRPLQKVTIASPFVLRTAEPPPGVLVGRTLADVRRMGKRIVLEFQGDLFMVIHLMIAGRLRWQSGDANSGKGAKAAKAAKGAGAAGAGKGNQTPKPPKSQKGQPLASFAFPGGTLLLTEAGTKHRASLHLLSGAGSLAAFDRGGLNILGASPDELGVALRRQNRTLKRALTDPRIVDGVGNAYSDEILHQARLSPFRLTGGLTSAEVGALHRAANKVLTEWIARLRAEAGSGFLEKVTAFHPEMAVHGKYGQACPVCGAPIQRIVYADNEANYCPGCQTGGRVLADRALSRLLREDWPRTMEELEQMRGER